MLSWKVDESKPLYLGNNVPDVVVDSLLDAVKTTVGRCSLTL
jgi:hypothetical protein